MTVLISNRICKHYHLVFLVLFLTATGVNASTIDVELINKYKMKSVVAGVHLKALSKVYEHFSKNYPGEEINNYLISISEDKERLMIYFRVPRHTPVLGGGGGDYYLNKSTMEIENVKFYK